MIQNDKVIIIMPFKASLSLAPFDLAFTMYQANQRCMMRWDSNVSLLSWGFYRENT